MLELAAFRMPSVGRRWVRGNLPAGIGQLLHEAARASTEVALPLPTAAAWRQGRRRWRRRGQN